jgi:hypothetical protein
MNAVPQRTFELLDATQEFASEQITERPDAVPGSISARAFLQRRASRYRACPTVLDGTILSRQ